MNGINTLNNLLFNQLQLTQKYNTVHVNVNNTACYPNNMLLKMVPFSKVKIIHRYVLYNHKEK